MEEEKAATTPVTRGLKWAVAIIASAMSLYHMYVAGFGPPEAMIFRGTHLLFTLTLIFLLYPTKPGGHWGWRGWAVFMPCACRCNIRTAEYRTHMVRQPQAMRRASKIAAISVQTPGTQTSYPYARDLPAAHLAQ